MNSLSSNSACFLRFCSITTLSSALPIASMFCSYPGRIAFRFSIWPVSPTTTVSQKLVSVMAVPMVACKLLIAFDSCASSPLEVLAAVAANPLTSKPSSLVASPAFSCVFVRSRIAGANLAMSSTDPEKALPILRTPSSMFIFAATAKSAETLTISLACSLVSAKPLARANISNAVVSAIVVVRCKLSANLIILPAASPVLSPAARIACVAEAIAASWSPAAVINEPKALVILLTALTTSPAVNTNLLDRKLVRLPNDLRTLPIILEPWSLILIIPDTTKLRAMGCPP